MVERSSITATSEKPSEELVMFRRAIEKTGTLSLPNRTSPPRGLVAAQARFQRAPYQIPDTNQTPMIGNWFWNIG